LKITLINGSPKPRKSASGLIADALRHRIGDAAECAVRRVSGPDCGDIPASLDGSDALVLVFPLYVDGVPSQLLRFLDEALDDIARAAKGAAVYVVVNNGFFEGRQNRVVFEIMRNFATRAGLRWGQAIGVGAGGMIYTAPIGRGTMKNLGKALDALAENILNARSGADYTFEPNFPRALYKAMGHRGWRRAARKNGLRTKQLYAKP
jgi:multimeric flavodoxin WrbA